MGKMKNKSLASVDKNGIVDSLRMSGNVYNKKVSLKQSYYANELYSLKGLFAILSIARSYGSDSEKDFIADLLHILNKICASKKLIDRGATVSMDTVGNIIVSVGIQPTTLWSCHTDTVHPKHNGFGDLVYNNQFVCSKEKRQLGADDGVGVWIMLCMISMGCTGLYIFHRGEEVGGIGSKYIADNSKYLIENCRRAIAFDRKGTGSIITHMGCGKVCSTEFADALGKALNIGHYPDATGVYTDTAEYEHIVPECTNVSSGYYSEHTFGEYLDCSYAVRLCKAVIEASLSGAIEDLPTVRKAGDSGYSKYWEDYFDDKYNYQTKSTTAEIDKLIDVVLEDPETVACILMDMGVDIDYIRGYADGTAHSYGSLNTERDW